jgi:hypothetical protein
MRKIFIAVAVVAIFVLVIIVVKPSSHEGFHSVPRSDAILSPVRIVSTDVYSLSTPDHVILD